jgi:DNA polymerase-3 subunit epsilon
MLDTTHLLGFDLETTGLSLADDEPVSYALTWCDNTETRDDYGLVAPTRPIAPEATAKHGITDEQAARDGQPLREALKRIGNDLVKAGRQGWLLVGMNISFDLSIVDAQLRLHFGRGLYDVGWRGPVLDIYVIDRVFSAPRRGSRQLDALCEFYGVELTDAHNALGDARATVEIARRQLTAYPRIAEMDGSRLIQLQEREHLKWLRNLNDYRREHGGDPIKIPNGWPIDTSQRSS